MNDVLGNALWDYYHKERTHKLWIYNRYGRREQMPLEIYFRTEDDMPDLEVLALQLCRGKVLDAGAGPGSHSLVLQQRGLDVTALDVSPKAMEVAQLRGVQNTVCADVLQWQTPSFDTVLLLMNGIGLTGSLQGLSQFLKRAKIFIPAGGQLLFDSSDVAYLYKRQPRPTNRYYGEIEYLYQYKNEKTDWFTWLYVDAETLTGMATQAGWHTEVLMDDGYNQYLARLTHA